MLLGRALNQDAWILSQHPALEGLAETWTQLYEERGAGAAQAFLEQRKEASRLNVQVLDDNGQALVRGTFPPRAAAFEARQHIDLSCIALIHARRLVAHHHPETSLPKRRSQFVLDALCFGAKLRSARIHATQIVYCGGEAVLSSCYPGKLKAEASELVERHLIQSRSWRLDLLRQLPGQGL
ncbi:hypothetical protein D9M69_537090 [compost metagenome]